MPPPLTYTHVDVFSPCPYGGNSLAVFPDAGPLDSAQMARITGELRHFESIFMTRTDRRTVFDARVFDLVEELDFAGHPVIGAACALHATTSCDIAASWTIRLPARTVTVETERLAPRRFSAMLDQGQAEFLGSSADGLRAEIASWFALTTGDLDPQLPAEVVSTGLRYLVLPVSPAALSRARIAVADLEARLAGLGAQFAYLVDAAKLEARHWNNDGIVEDVATGSGAGCAAAWLRRHGRLGDGETATLRQGRFTGRPSEIIIRAHGTGTRIRSVEVGGEVSIVGSGRLDVIPE